jgi:hypothetical protein
VPEFSARQGGCGLRGMASRRCESVRDAKSADFLVPKKLAGFSDQYQNAMDFWDQSENYPGVFGLRLAADLRAACALLCASGCLAALYAPQALGGQGKHSNMAAEPLTYIMATAKSDPLCDPVRKQAAAKGSP